MGIKTEDTVLAYHGVMIYDAKVLKIDHGQGVHPENDRLKPTEQTQYFVHYLGWHKKWDEWVPRARLLEVTPAHRELQRKAKEEAKKMKKSATKKKKISTGGIDPALSKQSPFKKQKIDAQQDTEEPMAKTEHKGRHAVVNAGPDPTDFDGARQVALQMPFALKKQLVEDWKHVTHSPLKLVKLPRKPSVAQIVAEYVAFKKSKSKVPDGEEDKELQSVEALMEGIQAYFDRAVGSILLYRHERQQYEEIKKRHPDTPLSQIYGAEHLVRLFVRLPRLLGAATMPEREIPQLQPRLNDFLKFMQKHASAWFSNDYDDADVMLVAATTSCVAPAAAVATD